MRSVNLNELKTLLKPGGVLPHKAFVLVVLGLFLLSTFSAAPWGAGVAFGQGKDSFALVDNFTTDSMLNGSLWTNNSSFLSNLANASSSPPATFVVPILTFSHLGMEMTGLSQDYETTGVQSLATFSAPFKVATTVEPTQGTANPFEIFLANADLTQFLTVTCNVSSSYDGMWAEAPNVPGQGQLWQLGEQFQPPITPALNTVYQIRMSVDALGGATVSIASRGVVLGSLTNLQPGTGPFYLVLGQRIGNAVTGSQVAYWKNVRVSTF